MSGTLRESGVEPLIRRIELSPCDRVPSGYRTGGAGDRLERRRVARIGLADGHRFELIKGTLKLALGDADRLTQPLDVAGAFAKAVGELLCPGDELGLDALRELGQAVDQLTGASGRLVEAADQLPATRSRFAHRPTDQLRPARGSAELARDLLRTALGLATALGKLAGTPRCLSQPRLDLAYPLLGLAHAGGEPFETAPAASDLALGSLRRLGLLRESSRPDHRRDRVQLREPALPCADLTQPARLRDRAVVADQDDVERGCPAGAHHLAHTLEVLACLCALRQLTDVRRTGIEAQRRRREHQQRHEDQHRRDTRLRQGPSDRRQPARGLSRGGSQPPAIDPPTQQREAGRHRHERRQHRDHGCDAHPHGRGEQEIAG